MNYRTAFGVVLALTVAGGVFSLTEPAKKLSRELNQPTPVSDKQQVLSDASHAFNEIAQQAIPAVVSISVIKEAEDPLAAALGLPKGHAPITPPEGLRDGLPSRSLGIGSGVVIRPNGYILTNNHVVENAEKITVTIDEKHKRSAKVIGIDPKTDLAVIKIDPAEGGHVAPMPFLNFGNSDEIRVGDWAVAIGSPFGLNRSVTSGIISAKGRAQMGIVDIEDFIQTDAAINPGSSGGPLLNAKGEMIGLNTAIFSQGGGSIGIGFAIPSSIARQVSEQIISQGHVVRGWLGVAAQDLDPDLARHFQVPGDPKRAEGAVISDVNPVGPAGQSGLRTGDVVLRFGSKAVTDAGEFKNLVGKAQVGHAVDLDVLRNGKHQKTTVTIAQQPIEKVEQPPKAHQQAGRAKAVEPTFGLKVDDVPGEIAKMLGMGQNHGALVTGVKPDSPAFDSGLEPGDIILQAGATEIESAQQFRSVARGLVRENPAVLYVQRGPVEKVFVPIKSAADED